ncbi:MAG: acetate--CoA ligase family protein [Pseudomonadota bacterium]
MTQTGVISPLSRHFNPSSVAVVGASTVPEKWGHFIARHCLLGSAQRRVYLINRSGGELLGQVSYTSLDELPEVPEFVVLVVPPAACESAIDEALALGCKGFLITAGGFSETDKEGAAREQRIVEKLRAQGARMFGPNCIGLHDAAADFHAGRILYPNGSIGMVSQSGVITHDLSRYCAEHNSGFSRVINLGNQADVNLCDSIASFVGHEPTKALVVYSEDLIDGREFAAASADVVASGIPVILLTVGASEAAVDSARSHTGALVSDLAVVDSACVRAGVHRVDTVEEAFSLAQAFVVTAHLPRGDRVGILSDGGGPATLATELIANAGLSLPEFSPALRNRITQVSGARTATRNPVDLAGEADQDIAVYQKVANEMLSSGEIDALFFTGCLGYYANHVEAYAPIEREVANQIVTTAAQTAAPVIVHSLYPVSETCDIFRQCGAPVFRDQIPAVRALRAMVNHATGADPQHPPSLGETTNGSSLSADYWAARQALIKQGLIFPAGVLLENDENLDRVISDVGTPLVVKAVGLEHKSDAGGVVFGIADAVALRDQFRCLTKSFPDSPISVERQLPVAEGVELLLGVKVDPRFGPVATVGLGGIYTEIFQRVAVALLPLTTDDAIELINSLPGADILSGARGRPSLDVHAAARALVALGDFATGYRESIKSIEINPLLVLEEGAWALDVLVELQSVEGA